MRKVITQDMRKVITQNIKLILALVGVVLIAISQTFHITYVKVEVDHLVAEIGALLLVLGVLHFMFELRLRDEMLKEVSSAVLGNERLHQSGLIDCVLNTRDINEPALWEVATDLTIGLQYSPRFIQDFHWVIERRAAAGRHTTVLLMDETSAAARYLRESNTGIADIPASLARVRQIIAEAVRNQGHSVTFRTHDRVLRYSFIRTEEAIWIKFYTNSNTRVTIPALKVGAGTPLYVFFDADIQRLGGAA